MQPRGAGVVTDLQRAVGAEILAETARQRRTHKSVYEAVRLDPKSWRRYIARPSRAMSLEVLERLAGELELSVSEILRRAETSLDESPPHPAGR